MTINLTEVKLCHKSCWLIV